MKLKYGMISNPIKIIFIGRDLRNLLNIVIKECRIYLFSKDNKSSGYLFDSSPLYISKNSSEDLQLILDWSEKTFKVSSVKPDKSQVALGSIVKTDSPLVAFGSAFVGDLLTPLQIEWSFENNRPLNIKFNCIISYYEERCKSNSIQIFDDISNKGSLGLIADKGFLKVAFQFPPKDELPVKLKIMQDEELAISLHFFLDQIVVNMDEKSFKHYFHNKYQEGEWLNLDLIPISNSSLSYLTWILKKACTRRILGLKSTSSCLESYSDKNYSKKDNFHQSTQGSCKNELLQNMARSRKILSRDYNVPNLKEFETSGIFELSSNFKLLMAIDEEIIGKLECI